MRAPTPRIIGPCHGDGPCIRASQTPRRLSAAPRSFLFLSLGSAAAGGAPSASASSALRYASCAHVAPERRRELHGAHSPRARPPRDRRALVVRDGGSRALSRRRYRPPRVRRAASGERKLSLSALLIELAREPRPARACAAGSSRKLRARHVRITRLEDYAAARVRRTRWHRARAFQAPFCVSLRTAALET